MQTHEQRRRSPFQPDVWPGITELWRNRIAPRLAAERSAWASALAAPAFRMLLVAFALALGLAAQLPLRYVIDVGHEEGYLSDLPMLRDFNTAEDDVHGTFRWTRDGATILLPGLGRRPVMVRLDFFPINARMAAAGPDQIEVWSHNRRLVTLPVHPGGARYTLAIPAYLLHDGTLSLTLRSQTFTPPGDPRQLGAPLSQITVTSAQTTVPVQPDWWALGTWLVTAILLWATLRRALGSTNSGRRWATWLFAASLSLIALSAVLDPPRWAFGARPALMSVTLCYLLVLALRPGLQALAQRFGLSLDQKTPGWLVLVVVAATGLRYAGRLYPRSMHGDIGFHTNRFYDTALGQIYLLSRNRGIDFPYPSGPYLTLAPLTLTGVAPPAFIQLSAVLAEGLGAVLVFAIVAWTGQAARHWPAHQAPSMGWIHQTALLAAAIYALSAAGFMTTWWSFSTHIYAQFATLLLISALVYLGVRSLTENHQANDQRQTRGGAGALPQHAGLILGILMSGVFLGHFGFLINTVLLASGLIGIIWIAAWRGNAWARTLRWPLLLSLSGAGLFAGIFFYSAYLPLFLTQAQAVLQGGLTGLAERAPVSRAYLWGILWEGGLLTHFGFFPLLLAPIGMLSLLRWGPPARILFWLMAGSLLVSALFAGLPFITLSTQSTRWLMFSAWAIAIGAALALQLLWRYGRAGRLAVLGMVGFMLWNTFQIWLGPMIWRIRPPEPF